MGRRIGGAGGGSDPGSSKGTLVAIVLAGSVAAAGGGLSFSGSAAGGAADSVGGQSFSAKKADAKKSAQKGDADAAWRRMGMRTLKRRLQQDLTCVANSFGQVRQYFLHTPCRSLDRLLFAITDGQSNTVVVSVAWVSFRSRSNAQDFKRLDDRPGTGNISPLSGTLLGMADIRFTGQHYQSRSDRNTVVVAEAEPVSGQLTDETLDTIADIAVLLPRP